MTEPTRPLRHFDRVAALVVGIDQDITDEQAALVRRGVRARLLDVAARVAVDLGIDPAAVRVDELPHHRPLTAEEVAELERRWREAYANRNWWRLQELPDAESQAWVFTDRYGAPLPDATGGPLLPGPWPRPVDPAPRRRWWRGPLRRRR